MRNLPVEVFSEEPACAWQLVVKKNSWDSLKRKLKQITKKTKPYGFEERLKKLAEAWRGWVNNYRLASIHAKLKAIDEWLRNEERFMNSAEKPTHL